MSDQDTTSSVCGTFSIQVSDDASKAYLTITPSEGGTPVSEEKILEALAAKNISHGIKKEAIQRCLNENSSEKCVVAEASLPVHGKDSVFESLVPEVKDTRPKIKEDGRVDYHEIGTFITVKAGDSLMRRHPAGGGSDGMDVYGKTILAKAGKELPFARNLTGVEFDATDSNLLLSTENGQPEIVERGIKVSSVLEVNNVDLTIGNINFGGTVMISGDVAEGMKVIAGGDIIVSGMVEGAELQAEGNIVITKGVIGRGEVRAENGEPGTGAAKLKCEGSIEARFIENAIVESAGNITIGELVSHCEMSALNQVLVGKKGAKKGHILGGITKAMVIVYAQVIGSQSNVKTFIEVGNNPELHKRAKRVKSELEEKSEESDKLTTLLSRLRLQSDEKSKAIVERVLATQEQLNLDIDALEEKNKILKAQDRLAKSSRVVVGKHAFSGTSITICDKIYKVPDRTEAGEFLLIDGKAGFNLR